MAYSTEHAAGLTEQPTPPAPSALSPGWKTSEFWLTLFAAIIGAIQMTGLLTPTTLAGKILGAAVLFLSALGYQTQRSSLKGQAIKAVAASAAKSLVLLLAFCVLTISAGGVGGCAADPIARADKATLVLDGAERGLKEAVVSGLISRDHAAELVAPVSAAHAAKTTVVTAALAGDKNTVNLAIDTFEAAVTAFVQAIARAKDNTLVDAAMAAHRPPPTPPPSATGP